MFVKAVLHLRQSFLALQIGIQLLRIPWVVSHGSLCCSKQRTFFFFRKKKKMHQGKNISKEWQRLKIDTLSSLSLSAMSTHTRSITVSNFRMRRFPLQVGFRLQGSAFGLG